MVTIFFKKHSHKYPCYAFSGKVHILGNYDQGADGDGDERIADDIGT